MNIVIVEDEPMVARRLARFVTAAFDTKANLRVFETLDDADDYLNDHAVDLLFLDLNLNERDGFDLLSRTLDPAFLTIVVSANTDRAIEAFELGVTDFIPKPFTQDRVNIAAQRVDQRLRRRGAPFLTIKKAGRLERIAIDNILYLKADGHYTHLVFQSGRTALYDKSIEQALQLLPDCYLRLHRSYAVSLENVTALIVEEGSRYEAELINGERLPIGRTRYPSIKEQYSSFQLKSEQVTKPK